MRLTPHNKQDIRTEHELLAPLQDFHVPITMDHCTPSVTNAFNCKTKNIYLH